VRVSKLTYLALVLALLAPTQAWSERATDAEARDKGSVGNTATLETPALVFRITAEDGGYEILDKRANVAWRSDPYEPRFGRVTLNVNGAKRELALDRCDVARAEKELEITFHPLPDRPQAWLKVTVRALADDRTLELAYNASEDLEVERLRLLDDALWTTDAEKGYVIVPVRMGLLIPADSGLESTHTFDTYAYEGCHMRMLGVVKGGATALLTWDDPYVAAEIRSSESVPAGIGAKQVLSTSMVLRKSAKSVRVRFDSQGDYVSLAKTYRQIAAEKGLLVRWQEKLKENPERRKLLGAINFKLWATLRREMNEESTKEELVKVNWTFDEAAQVAEHLKNDLKLDKVLFVMGGWIHRGYDNQHPDILPAAPECGGDAALAQCARRVMQLGYILDLHDNYQDIYRDSPSWDEGLIMKAPDGSLVKGGRWWGGRAYLTCSRKALELAQRPQNLTAVKKLTGANSYFIDTTYASGLQECFDPAHPLTRADDMQWKQALSDYARSVFGIFGSEDGREWAIPHSDFFEGLTGVDRRWFHDQKLAGEVGGVSIPLFEIVYRDSIALYGKYGFDISKSAEYVLYHISIGRLLNYHDIPPHLYWKEAPQETEDRATNTADATRNPALFVRADGGWAEGLHPLDRFVKNTYEILSPLNEITAQMPLAEHQFLTPDRKVVRTVFGEGAEKVEVVVNTSSEDFRHKSRLGGNIILPPYGFLVESPTFVAFHARNWNGIAYEAPPLITLRSRDSQPLERSNRVRVYHGFGDPRVMLGRKVHTVEKEAVVSKFP
jgi:hypothetical protein